MSFILQRRMFLNCRSCIKHVIIINRDASVLKKWAGKTIKASKYTHRLAYSYLSIRRVSLLLRASFYLPFVIVSTVLSFRSKEDSVIVAGLALVSYVLILYVSIRLRNIIGKIYVEFPKKENNIEFPRKGDNMEFQKRGDKIIFSTLGLYGRRRDTIHRKGDITVVNDKDTIFSKLGFVRIHTKNNNQYYWLNAKNYGLSDLEALDEIFEKSFAKQLKQGAREKQNLQLNR